MIVVMVMKSIITIISLLSSSRHYVVKLGMAFRDIAEKEKVTVTNEEIQGNDDDDNSDVNSGGGDDDDDMMMIIMMMVIVMMIILIMIMI